MQNVPFPSCVAGHSQHISVVHFLESYDFFVIVVPEAHLKEVIAWLACGHHKVVRLLPVLFPIGVEVDFVASIVGSDADLLTTRVSNFDEAPVVIRSFDAKFGVAYSLYCYANGIRKSS